MRNEPHEVDVYLTSLKRSLLDNSIEKVITDLKGGVFRVIQATLEDIILPIRSNIRSNTLSEKHIN